MSFLFRVFVKDLREKGFKMAKRLILLMLIFVNLIVVSASAGPEISLKPEEIVAVPGEEFTVFVQLDPADEEIYGYQYSLNFDSEILKVVNQRSGTFLSKYGSALTVNNGFDNEKGTLSYGETLLGEKIGVKDKGITGSITFRVKDSSRLGRESTLEIKDLLFSDPYANKIEDINVKNGVLKVVETSGGLRKDSSEIPVSEINNIIDPHLLSLIENPVNEESYIPIIVTVENGQLYALTDLIDFYGNRISNVHEMPVINALSAEAWPSIVLEISEKAYVERIILGTEGVLEVVNSSTDPGQVDASFEITSENIQSDSKEPSQNDLKGSDTSALNVENKNKKSPGYGIIISLVLLFYSYITLKKK